MGCGCGKSFSNSYATGQRYKGGATTHVPTTRPAPVSIQSKSLQAKTVQAQAAASSGRRKV